MRKTAFASCLKFLNISQIPDTQSGLVNLLLHTSGWEVLKMKFCAPSEFICWNNLQSEEVSRRGAVERHERGALLNDISTLFKETSESSLTPSTMWGLSETMAISEPEKGSHQLLNLTGTLILVFQPSELRNKFLLFITTRISVCGILL